MRFRSLVAATAACLTLTAAPVPAVAADANAMVITGSGWISPGLGAIPTYQSLSFTGTATTVGTQSGTYSCYFTGTVYAGTGGGYGEFSGSCGPISFYACIVVLVGPSWGFECASTPWAHVGWFKGTFTPTNVNPTTHYDLVLSGVVIQGT